MNRQNIARLRKYFQENFIEKKRGLKVNFNMEFTYEPNEYSFKGTICSWVADIVGHTLILFDEKIDRRNDLNNVKKAKEILGLDDVTARKLFYPNVEHWDKITPQQVIDQLTRLLIGKEIDWKTRLGK